jgi:hypothetical protein
MQNAKGKDKKTKCTRTQGGPTLNEEKITLSTQHLTEEFNGLQTKLETLSAMI